MGTHPINLGIRFLLELTALIAAGAWAYRQGDGWLGTLLGIGLPLLLAILWATFAVPDDPSRSGAAPVPTPGILRLVLELVILGFGVWALHQIGLEKWAWGVGIVLVLHYLVSYDRIWWLLSQ